MSTFYEYVRLKALQDMGSELLVPPGAPINADNIDIECPDTVLAVIHRVLKYREAWAGITDTTYRMEPFAVGCFALALGGKAAKRICFDYNPDSGLLCLSFRYPNEQTTPADIALLDLPVPALESQLKQQQQLLGQTIGD